MGLCSDRGWPSDKHLVGMYHKKSLARRDSLEKVIYFASFIITKIDEEVKKQLIKVKGIGPWTAEMFLMFTLARPDVFSHGDLGLRKGIKKIYGFKKDPSLKTVEKIKDW